ncbi:hypothetical protein F53441_13765 [Fusarium austroafricanum]|uniref:Uncharacterized protein n=1 Tax=Fusarium austroafricanum TaxID=2364996 RepID=A0A8H4JLK9_9HYPO|nr:hypothetical protein F53441_13765 [Fusarium austroafricanum]
MHLSTPALAVATTFLANGALAGAGAIVKACVYFSAKPQINVQWNTCGSASHCMYCKNLPNLSMPVTSAGLTCVNLGKVESKASSSGGDVCATDESHWQLSYNGGVYSGSASTRWRGGGTRHNSIELDDKKYSPGTAVCGSEAACVDPSTDWDAGTTPDIYFVFRPEQKAKSSWSSGTLRAIKEAIFRDSKKAASGIEVHFMDEMLADDTEALRISQELKV